jgi:hypothetical protein
VAGLHHVLAIGHRLGRVALERQLDPRGDAAGGGQLSAADLAGPLMVMARWPSTQAVELLLTPDVRRRSHPSADLEPEGRALADLQDSQDSARCPLLNLTPGAFIRWRS